MHPDIEVGLALPAPAAPSDAPLALLPGTPLEPVSPLDAAACDCGPGLESVLADLTRQRDRLAADLARAAGVSLEVIRVRYGLLASS
jgi:hypothetical protein